MSITSNRLVSVKYTGDIIANLETRAVENTDSPGSQTIHTLAVGNNTITLPTGGSTVKGATIIPPEDNENTITLKGVNGDTGIALNKVDPTTVTFDDPAPANFVLTAGAEITGLRIIWS